MKEFLLETVHLYKISALDLSSTMSNAQGGKEPSASKPGGEQGNLTAANKEPSNVDGGTRDDTEPPMKDLPQVPKSEVSIGDIDIHPFRTVS